jgi:hypothetical protein
MGNKFTKISLTIICFLAMTGLNAQFSGLFAIPNWTNVNTNSTGTTDVSGAPTSISQESSDGLSGAGDTDFLIVIAQSGTISFNWSYSTVDGAFYDYPEVLLNGTPTLVTGFNMSGSSVQSGTQAGIPVCVGDVFGFRAHSVDNVAGPCTTIFSAFNFAPGPILPVSAPGTTACPGSTVTLTASGATSFTWNPGNYSGNPYTFSSPSANTIYTVTGSDGCSAGTGTTLLNVLIPTITVSGNTLICPGQTANLTAAGANTFTWNTGPQTASISLSPTVTNSYSVTGTNSVGCDGTSVVSVSLMPQPNISITGNTVICYGGTVNLNVQGASTYSWSTGATTSSISVSPTTAAVYTVTGTGTVNSCSSVLQQSVIVNPLPVMSTTGTGIMCLGQTATLSACCAAGYFWSHGAGNTATVIVSPSTNTTYTVNGVSLAGCTKSVSATVFVSICTGMNEFAQNEILRIYPNPSNGEFIIEVSGSTRLVIYDLLGSVMLEKELSEGENKINMDIFPDGVYFGTFRMNGESKTVRIVKH